MSSAEQQPNDEQVLIRYLLGSLPEEEAEHLDELSIADDAFAWRLSTVENDLVDAYVRGEISGENLSQFKKSYLASPRRLQKVDFAQALSSLNAKTVPELARTRPKSKPEKELPENSSSFWRWFTVPRLVLQRGFAGGALALLFTAGYLFLDNTRMHRQLSETQGVRAAINQREQILQSELNDQRAANAEKAKELDRLRESRQNLDQLKTLSVLLLPPTRGAGRIPMVSVPQGTSLVALVLPLESDDFPSYRVQLKDPAKNQIVWRGANLEAASGGPNKTVATTLPAHLLRPQNYILELSGVASDGHAELISGYPIRVTIQ
jgi:hypothetical protein